MVNTFVRMPQRGDVWLREIATRKDCFISLQTIDVDKVDATAYEVLGSVAHVDDKGILVVYKQNASKAWCNRCWWCLDGYTLDGTDRSGVISARFSTNSWGANIDKTVSYNCTTIDGLVAALNTAFAADSDFITDDWEASVIDGRVRLTAVGTDYRQYANTTAKAGFSFPGGSMPEMKASSNMLRKNGHVSGDWAISNMEKAISYLRQDNVGWKPSAPVNTFKSQQPLCLPVYLGTSTAVAGDMCEYVRSVFGEGEDGWKNYLKCCEPVFDTRMGIFAIEDGKQLTDLLGSMRYSSPKVEDGVMSPMCDYVRNIATATISAGELYVPSAKQLGQIMYGIKYGTTPSRTADALNESLNRIKGSAIANTANWWSVCRFNSDGAWCSHGYGIFSNSSVYGGFGVLPVLHLEIAKQS